MSDIRLTANDDEPWRIDRLRKVARGCPRSVLALHDHKGTLFVNWSAPPKLRELTEVVQAWAAQNEVNIEHYVCGAEYDVESQFDNPYEAADA
jgi:hypothetical protein